MKELPKKISILQNDELCRLSSQISQAERQIKFLMSLQNYEHFAKIGDLQEFSHRLQRQFYIKFFEIYADKTDVDNHVYKLYGFSVIRGDEKK